jgi:hypothetical protein
MHDCPIPLRTSAAGLMRFCMGADESLSCGKHYFQVQRLMAEKRMTVAECMMARPQRHLQ